MTTYRVPVQAVVVTTYDIEATSPEEAQVFALRMSRHSFSRIGWDINTIGTNEPGGST